MKFGVRDSAPSPRVYTYEAVGGIELPKALTVTDLPKVKNQGSVNSCCACAAAEILEVLNGREFDSHTEFSEGYIYGRCRSENGKYEGMYPDLLVEELRKK